MLISCARSSRFRRHESVRWFSHADSRRVERVRCTVWIIYNDVISLSYMEGVRSDKIDIWLKWKLDSLYSCLLHTRLLKNNKKWRHQVFPVGQMHNRKSRMDLNFYSIISLSRIHFLSARESLNCILSAVRQKWDSIFRCFLTLLW